MYADGTVAAERRAGGVRNPHAGACWAEMALWTLQLHHILPPGGARTTYSLSLWASIWQIPIVTREWEPEAGGEEAKMIKEDRSRTETCQLLFPWCSHCAQSFEGESVEGSSLCSLGMGRSWGYGWGKYYWEEGNRDSEKEEHEAGGIS